MGWVSDGQTDQWTELRTLMNKVRALPSKEILNLVERKEDMDYDKK